MLIAFIIGCEIAFWIFVAAGLIARYPLRLRRTGMALLACTPIVDVVLLIATVIHLRSGGETHATHGLAAAYIGFSVAFGHDMIRWADQRFAHRFAGGPPPWKPPKYGRERARYEWRLWFKALLGAAIACVVLLGCALFVGDFERSEPLFAWMSRMGGIVTIWFFIALSYTIWPKQPPAREQARTDAA